MNSNFDPKTLLFLASMCALAGGSQPFAGDLEPPGFPAPTMKTLEEVEPRIPVQSLPRVGMVYVISEPGSYYLVDNIVLVNGVAIAIEASDVVLDLNGFALIGSDSADSAINIMGGRSNIAIRNGTIRDWPVNGIFGINCAACTIEDLLIENTGSRVSTPSLWLGWSGVVRRVTVRGNETGPGIQIEFNGFIADSIASENLVGFYLLGDTGAIYDSIAVDNIDEGIHLEASSVAARCTVGLSRFGVVLVGGGQVRECLLAANGNAVAVYGTGALVENNLMNESWNETIYLDAVAQGARIASNAFNCSSGLPAIETGGGSGHLIVGNTFRGCFPEINGGGANAIGEILDHAGGDPVTSANPYANIRY